jgi:hypothetical protein
MKMKSARKRAIRDLTMARRQLMPHPTAIGEKGTAAQLRAIISSMLHYASLH